MKDAQHLTNKKLNSYNKIFYSYIRTFNRLGLKAIPMSADTGPIGGDLSHEFVILAETGESQIYADKRIFDIDLNKYDFSDKSLEKMREDFSSIYAVTDDKYKEKILVKMLKKKTRLKQEELKLVIFFILAINTLNL